MASKRRRARSNAPQTVDGFTWYYEEKRGLSIVREVRDPSGRLISTEQFTIPWRMISASVDRNELKVRP